MFMIFLYPLFHNYTQSFTCSNSQIKPSQSFTQENTRNAVWNILQKKVQDKLTCIPLLNPYHAGSSSISILTSSSTLLQTELSVPHTSPLSPELSNSLRIIGSSAVPGPRCDNIREILLRGEGDHQRLINNRVYLLPWVEWTWLVTTFKPASRVSKKSMSNSRMVSWLLFLYQICSLSVMIFTIWSPDHSLDKNIGESSFLLEQNIQACWMSWTKRSYLPEKEHGFQHGTSWVNGRGYHYPPLLCKKEERCCY